MELQEEGSAHLRPPPISPEHLGPHKPHQLMPLLHTSPPTPPADRTFDSHTPSHHGGNLTGYDGELAGQVQPQDLEHTQRMLEIEMMRLSFSAFKTDGPNNPPLAGLDLSHCKTALRFKAQ